MYSAAVRSLSNTCSICNTQVSRAKSSRSKHLETQITFLAVLADIHPAHLGADISVTHDHSSSSITIVGVTACVVTSVVTSTTATSTTALELHSLAQDVGLPLQQLDHESRVVGFPPLRLDVGTHHVQHHGCIAGVSFQWVVLVMVVTAVVVVMMAAGAIGISAFRFVICVLPCVDAIVVIVVRGKRSVALGDDAAAAVAAVLLSFSPAAERAHCVRLCAQGLDRLGELAFPVVLGAAPCRESRFLALYGRDVKPLLGDVVCQVAPARKVALKAEMGRKCGCAVVKAVMVRRYTEILAFSAAAAAAVAKVCVQVSLRLIPRLL
ncbi:uncharacterized protein B0I36DRAFT_309972 [Microdochium trichocladiopsis]|uniref:Uncharacterized protein n=1 Tax=Microdochium trichocladiopsis TaxID=1682393 RepID=A0A9P8YJD8_9PEZI|nr:uncharacterized protein B0I36DRAFT_309972 [Microdochium trichocladiopsis]KAH7040120.1 hypothetical protein B0I36DRAFT_309972 [Microdochium trichocladiopsis]